jgi:hypothetical protein
MYNLSALRNMVQDNRTWGAERIRGELLKPGARVAKSTIRVILTDRLIFERMGVFGQDTAKSLKSEPPDLMRSGGSVPKPRCAVCPVDPNLFSLVGIYPAVTALPLLRLLHPLWRLTPLVRVRDVLPFPPEPSTTSQPRASYSTPS